MARYDRVYANLAGRAAAQGGVDIATFLQMSVDSGMSLDRIEELLQGDLDSNGPIFGKFMRSLTGAAGQSVLAAERQGNIAGTINGDAELRRLVNIAKIDDAIGDADPEALAALEEAVAPIEFTWVAALQNTCHLCLPLHGISRTMEEWNALGLSPETIHAGWDSACHCQLIPERETAGRSELVAPLVRKKIKSPTGLRPSRRTARSVAQADLDRSLAARDRALESIEGRRTLRLLGMADEAEGEDDG